MFLWTISSSLDGTIIHSQPVLKVAAFADDCVVSISSKKDSLLFYKIVEVYSSISQAKINVNKTECIPLLEINFPLLWNIKISNSPVRHLKILLSTKGVEYHIMKANFLKKISERISTWKNRSVSIIGRASLINTFIKSQLYFYSQGVSLTMSFIKKFYSISQTFLWQSRYPPFKILSCFRKTLSWWH